MNHWNGKVKLTQWNNVNKSWIDRLANRKFTLSTLARSMIGLNETLVRIELCTGYVNHSTVGVQVNVIGSQVATQEWSGYQ